MGNEERAESGKEKGKRNAPSNRTWWDAQVIRTIWCCTLRVAWARARCAHMGYWTYLLELQLRGGLFIRQSTNEGEMKEIMNKCIPIMRACAEAETCTVH